MTVWSQIFECFARSKWVCCYPKHINNIDRGRKGDFVTISGCKARLPEPMRGKNRPESKMLLYFCPPLFIHLAFTSHVHLPPTHFSSATAQLLLLVILPGILLVILVFVVSFTFVFFLIFLVFFVFLIFVAIFSWLAITITPDIPMFIVSSESSSSCLQTLKGPSKQSPLWRSAIKARRWDTSKLALVFPGCAKRRKQIESYRSIARSSVTSS